MIPNISRHGPGYGRCDVATARRGYPSGLSTFMKEKRVKMKFKEAFEKMKSGAKVKLPGLGADTGTGILKKKPL